MAAPQRRGRRRRRKPSAGDRRALAGTSNASTRGRQASSSNSTPAAQASSDVTAVINSGVLSNPDEFARLMIYRHTGKTFTLVTLLASGGLWAVSRGELDPVVYLSILAILGTLILVGVCATVVMITGMRPEGSADPPVSTEASDRAQGGNSKETSA